MKLSICRARDCNIFIHYSSGGCLSVTVLFSQTLNPANEVTLWVRTRNFWLALRSLHHVKVGTQRGVQNSNRLGKGRRYCRKQRLGNGSQLLRTRHGGTAHILRVSNVMPKFIKTALAEPEVQLSQGHLKLQMEQKVGPLQKSVPYILGTSQNPPIKWNIEACRADRRSPSMLGNRS